jgi:hypothetical protein
MSHNERFKNESQDARRKDKHNTVHPDEAHKNSDKLNRSSNKPSELKSKQKK